MEYRNLGSTDVKCSAICFGAWAIGGWMWGGSDRADAVKAIHAAYDEGITTIDTAPVYGQGLSEEIVGEAIKHVPRNKVQVLTKFGLQWTSQQGEYFFSTKVNDNLSLDFYKFSSKEQVIKECEDSLRRLGTDYIDVLQIHWPDATTPVSETMEALERLLQQGKIRAAGVCNYNVELLQQAEKTISLASNQVPYSMLVRDIEKDVVPYCLEHKKSIIAYSPLQRGLLTGKIKPGHQFNEGDTRDGNRHYTPENIARVQSFLHDLEPLAASHQATLSQLVIQWTLQQPGITIALVGARNAQQAVQNAQAIHVKLNQADVTHINQLIKAHEL